MAHIEIAGFECAKCGHKWVPRAKRAPKVCPKCKSREWKG